MGGSVGGLLIVAGYVVTVAVLTSSECHGCCCSVTYVYLSCWVKGVG